MTEESKKTEGTPESADNASEPKAPTIDELQAEIARLKAENTQIDKLKKSNSEACSDAAEWKRKYRATLDEAERIKQEQAERMAELEKANAAYEAKERVSTYYSKLMEVGYDSASARSMAEVLPPGVPDSYFESQKSFLAAKTQEIKTQTLNSQPGLSTGLPPTTPADAQSQGDAQLRRWFGLPTK